MCDRIHESAACADSCITSPSCPVIVRRPLPAYAVASMKRTSPPTVVYARPVATPGCEVRLRTSLEKRLGPSHSRSTLLVDLHLPAPPFATCVAALRHDVGDAPLEIADARLARVVADDRAQHLVRSVSCERLQAVRLELLRDEVALRDPELLLLGVARERDHVHAVEQRPRDRVERVRGADEERLREVERQIEVVVAERRVLLRVEHLEHRARRVAAPVVAHLVDLVDQHQRIRPTSASRSERMIEPGIEPM